MKEQASKQAIESNRDKNIYIQRRHTHTKYNIQYTFVTMHNTPIKCRNLWFYLRLMFLVLVFTFIFNVCISSGTRYTFCPRSSISVVIFVVIYMWKHRNDTLCTKFQSKSDLNIFIRKELLCHL